MTSQKPFFKVLILVSFLSYFFINTSCEKRDKKLIQGEIEKGKLLFNTVGCINCHSLNGEQRYGPSLKLNLGQKVTVLRDSIEQTVIVDRAYLKRAIVNPNFEKLKDFQNSTMAKTTLKSEDINNIVEYIVYVNTN